ncbi:Hypothetical predicted protein [Cloeon dipterum]|uniref:C-type lectin domain-containing protein n=1 Tax=Cloeon dipterum TaxID=197152 RepID=A0A8S1DGY3_9INSE|nr:Hypothetical predicted protein [Cloeon dipterum]
MRATLQISIFSLFLPLLLWNRESGVEASTDAVCACQPAPTKPVYFSDYTNLHSDYCDRRTASELEKLTLEKLECEYQTALFSSIHNYSLATCNTVIATKETLCDTNTQMQTEAIVACNKACPRPLQLESIKTSEIVKLATGSYFLSSPTQQMNWHMADQFCKSNGLELASVETIKENDALVAAFGPGTDRFWISGNDLGSEKTFYWSGVGKTMETFWYFEKGQPDNANNNENCVQYFVDSRIAGATYKWNDDNCNTPFRFVCELEATK